MPKTGSYTQITAPDDDHQIRLTKDAADSDGYINYDDLKDDIGGDVSGLTTRVTTLEGYQHVTGVFHICEQQASGTDSVDGALASGSWSSARTLNTTIKNTITGASLASSQITLPAGTYRAFVKVPLYGGNNTMAKLYDTTAATDLLLGSSEYSASATSVVVWSTIYNKEFTLTVESVLDVRQQCSTTTPSTGSGRGSSFSVVNTYTEVYIEELAT